MTKSPNVAYYIIYAPKPFMVNTRSYSIELYTERDYNEALRMLRTVYSNIEVDVDEGVCCIFHTHRAEVGTGHITIMKVIFKKRKGICEIHRGKRGHGMSTKKAGRGNSG